MTGSRESDTFRPGELLNNTYRIEAVIGRGGTSDVYRARNEISGRLVALKSLRSEFSGNEDYLTLMRREEEIREIRHDAVVRYSENQRSADGIVYLVMDFVEGPVLSELVKTGGLPAEDVLTIARRAAEGLEAAHARGIVHRDMSPDNVILRGGDPAHAVIIDFGIAKDVNPGAQTIVGNEFAGKYAYAAPEQLRGVTDARSDIYSLGVTLYALVKGGAPDLGRNPMEVVENKANRLDTSGIPEPLKALIDRACAPDPAERFQSAREMLDFLGGVPAADPALSDQTVIARPGATIPPAPRSPAPPAGHDKPPRTAAPQSGSHGPLIAVLVVVLAAGLGALAWVGGFIGGLPTVEPYTLVIEKPDEEAPFAVGYMPDEAGLAAVSTLMEQIGGTADLTLARGPIHDTWARDVTDLLRLVSGTEQWRIEIQNSTARVTALTDDRNLHAALEQRLGQSFPGGLDGRANIILGPLLLDPARVGPLLAQWADCGPLTLRNPPQLGYPPGTPVRVDGHYASEGTRLGLTSAIAEISGDRDPALTGAVLNAPICAVVERLPLARDGGIRVEYSYGDRPGLNPDGIFVVGENPVIDVILPEDMTSGYLSVIVLDVSGNVFHLLPNTNTPENAVAALRGGQGGERAVRVAHPLGDVDDASKIAFLVDDTALGKSMIVALHTASPLFEGVRPTTESAAALAQALDERGGAAFLAASGRVLETRAR